MTLPVSPNIITMNQVNAELGLSGAATITLNDTLVRTLFGKSSGVISMSDGHGKTHVAPSVEYLVVAAGGSGGSAGYGGGGGAGGMLTGTGYAVTKGVSITIVVPAGVTTIRTNGGNATMGTIVATGGGGGGDDYYGRPGLDGGSGGGGGTTNYGINAPGGAGIAGQGNRGGNNTGGYFRRVSGGGAGGPGVDNNGNYDNVGGLGLSNSITGTSVTYATGGPSINFTVPVPNSGNGGCTASNFVSHGSASGVVIIRYPNTYPDPTSVSGTPDITNTGGYKIYKWTNIGTWQITF